MKVPPSEEAPFLDTLPPQGGSLLAAIRRQARYSNICFKQLFDERLQRTWPMATPVFPGNKARMSMKTKEDDKQSEACADIAFECLRCAEGAGLSGCGVSLDLSLRDISDPRPQGFAPSVDSRTGGTKRECL